MNIAAFIPSRWPRYLMAGVVCYLAFLVATFPAYWMSSLLAAASRNEAALGHAQGTIWNGSAELVGQPNKSGHVLGRFNWQIRPLVLFTGALKFSIQIQGNDLAGRGDVGIGVRGLEIDSLDLHAPAQVIGKFNAVASFVDLDGRLQLRVDAMKVRRGTVLGSGHLIWQDAGSRNFKLTGLGSYRIEMKGNGAAADLQLATTSGDLQLLGSGQWKAENGGMLRFQGSATATGRQKELEPILRLIGNPAAPNRRDFSLSVPLPI